MTESDAQILFVWASIVGVSITTFLTRGSFLLFGSKVRLPIVVDHALAYAPACALAAIMAPDLLFVHGTLRLDATNPRLIAALAGVVGYALSRTMVVTILSGMLAFTAIRLCT